MGGGSLRLRPVTEALAVKDLVLRYGRTAAVRAASFTAESGLVTAVVGPNGAGKTSIIETCEGYRKPTSGTVRAFGLDPRADARALRPRIGVMLQEGGVPSGARSLDALRHMASLYKNPLDPVSLAERLGLRTVRATYRRMSGGEQQRLKFAIALIGRPEFVFLDEPTAGLDAAAKRVVWDVISELRANGVTVVLTTHLMDDVERLADQVVVIDAGAVVATGSPDELRGSEDDSLTFNGPLGLDLTVLNAGLPAGTLASESSAGRYEVTGDCGPHTLAAVTRWCAVSGFMPRDLCTGRRRLEDVVIQLTSGGVAHEHS